MIRIILVDDQGLIRESLRHLLSIQPKFEVIGEADNGESAIALIEKFTQAQQLPDVVLMDIRMPVMDGIETTKVINQTYPNIKVVILTTFDDDDAVFETLQAGAASYVLKDTTSDHLAASIFAAHQGYSQFSPGIVDKLVNRASRSTELEEAALALPEGFYNLTPREKEVFTCLGTGASNKEIAEALFISEGTAKNYVNNISAHLEIRDRVRLALLAHRLRPHIKE